MPEPKQQRDLSLLRLDFREKLEQWLNAVRTVFPAYQVNVHETLRSPERQRWLFEQGRSRPGPIVTWTLDSNHLYGIAADFHVAKDGEAIWDTNVYERIYAAVPPEKYGLESLAPTEWVHVQLADADNRREAPPAEDDSRQDRLLILYRNGEELERYALRPTTQVVRRDSADGSRIWIDLTN